MASLPFSSLSSSPLCFLSPFSYPSLHPSPSSRSPLFQLRGLGESCKHDQCGLGQSPSRNRFWCILALKSHIWCGHPTCHTASGATVKDQGRHNTFLISSFSVFVRNDRLTEKLTHEQTPLKTISTLHCIAGAQVVVVQRLNVPLDTLQVTTGTIFTGHMAKPTVSKH